MEHIEKPVNRVMEDIRRKMEIREKLEKKVLAIKLRKKKRPRIKNPGQRSFNL